MKKSNSFQELMNTTAGLKSLSALILVGTLMLGNAAFAIAGTNHARAVIGLGVNDNRGFHDAPAHAERHQGSKYRVVHEEIGYNYSYGNAGSGHAHHHSGPFHHSGGSLMNWNLGEQENSERQRTEIPPPVIGSRGTSQYIKQTWLPNATGDKIVVAWGQDSFLQVDTSELAASNRLVSRAGLTADGGLTGTVEISARLDKSRKPQIDTQLTGIFKGLKFKLVSHPGGVVSLQFQQPLRWSVPGKTETFDIALDASVDVGELASNPCVLDPGMVAAGNTLARRTTLAQTFIPTQNGSLTKITHGLQNISGVTNYDLLVTTTNGGLPSWTGGTYNAPNVLFKAIGLTVFSNSGVVNGVVTIPSGQEPYLTAGTQYALILIPGSPATGDMKWRGNSGAGTYPNGSAYALSGTTWTVPTAGPKDHGFKLDGLCP